MRLITKILLPLALVTTRPFGHSYADELNQGEVQSVRLTMLQDAAVNSNRIYLTDIADCKGDAVLCREASGIDVSIGPPTGRYLHITQSQVRRVLEKEWPNAEVEFESSGQASESTTRVFAAQAEIRHEDVKKKLQVMLDKKIDPSGRFKISVTKVMIPFGSGVRPSQTEVDFPDLREIPLTNVDWIAKNMIGMRMTQFHFYSPKDKEDSQYVQGQASFVVEQKLPVAKSLLPSGSTVSENDIDEQWVALKRGAQDLMTSSEQIIGRRIKQTLSAGEAFAHRNLDAANVVTRNQAVTMIHRDGGLEVTAKVTVLDAGVKGQIIDVVNIASKKRMRAKVLDERTVEAVIF